MINLRKKIISIIIISIIITYLIYVFFLDKRINIVSIGDGVSSGETSYNIKGISYNDYLKDYYEDIKKIKNYNNKYSYKDNTLNDLINNFNNNERNNIKQVIHDASILTIGIGEEELVKLVMTNNFNKDSIEKFLNNYDILLKSISKVTDAKIVLLSFYENYYLTKRDIIILNSNLANLAQKYNCYFININDLLLNKDYFFSSKDYYFNYKAHKEIATMIINTI